MLKIAEFANDEHERYWNKKSIEHAKRIEMLKDISRIVFILIIFIVTGLIGGIAL